MSNMIRVLVFGVFVIVWLMLVELMGLVCSKMLNCFVLFFVFFGRMMMHLPEELKQRGNAQRTLLQGQCQ